MRTLHSTRHAQARNCLAAASLLLASLLLASGPALAQAQTEDDDAPVPPRYDNRGQPVAPVYRPGLPARANDGYQQPGDANGGLYSPTAPVQPAPKVVRPYGSGAQSAGSYPPRTSNSYPQAQAPRSNDAYRPPSQTYGEPSYDTPAYPSQPAYGQAPERSGQPYDRGYGSSPPGTYADQGDVPPPSGGYRQAQPGSSESPGTYSEGEIVQAGRQLFGSISRGLASAIEHTFAQSGRPNGYILGEDGGGAFFAGLRYGEGTLFTKDLGSRRIFWQGPSLGYDVGGEGAKTMVLVYNLRDPSDMYHRFGGVEGTAYLVGGVSLQYQRYGDIVIVPIRSGVGLRLGANVGYMKYTPQPTWNPF